MPLTVSPKLTIWSNANFDGDALAALVSEVGDHQLVRPESQGNNLTAGGRSELLATADVAFGQPDPEQVIELPRLRWVHLTSAGYTRYDRPDVSAAIAGRNAWLTNSSSVFDDPCAQHVLAFMLAQARQLPAAFASQGQWAYNSLRGRSRVLRGETVLILGYGAIARRLVELVSPFDVKVVAVRQRVRGDEAVQVYPVSELPTLLPLADHIVNVLPSSSSADGLLDAQLFGVAKPGAVLYNVGRGSTVDQSALIASLESGHLAAAYLDVTTPEPLPSDHPLWRAPNCFITPHVAGGMQNEDLQLVEHFLANLRRFEAGQALQDVVFG